MKKLFAALLQELTAGRGAVLCGIVASRGSTPRGAGAKMLVMEDGSTVGTIGGGAVEYRAARLARELLAEGASRFESYRLTPGDAADIGMVCGGDVRVYFQYFNPADRTAEKTLEDALVLLDAPGPSWLITAMNETGWGMGIWDPKGGLRGLEISMDRLAPLLCGRGVLEEKRR